MLTCCKVRAYEKHTQSHVAGTDDDDKHFPSLKLRRDFGPLDSAI